MGLLRWGLIPSWARDPAMGSRLINARSETVAEKPAFRSAFRRRRCLVPADGFYEWKREGVAAGERSSKTPYWIHMASREPFAFAGLWERWDPREGPPVHTFTILTTEASAALRHIHPRMPVILPPAVWGKWLDTALEDPHPKDFFRPLPDGSLEAQPVSTLVNSPRNDDPSCIEPAAQP